MRYKTWPYYKDWSIIFLGKITPAVSVWAHSEMLFNKYYSLKVRRIQILQLPTMVYQEVSCSLMMNQKTCRPVVARVLQAHEKKKTRTIGAKRPRTDGAIDGSLVNMLTSFSEKSDAKLDKLVDKMASDKVKHSSMRKKMFTCLKNTTHLSLTQKIKITWAICDRNDWNFLDN